MSFLQDLMGGGQQRQENQDFANRYDQGHPSEGYDDDEVVSRYQQVAPQLSPQEYQAAAQQSFTRMAPEERMQFGQHLQQRARQQGYHDPAWDEDDNLYQDPAYISQVTGRLEQQQPGMLGQVLGGGGHPLARAGMAGVAAEAVKKMMGGR